ncbi:MAG TPA: M13 family metallopeptidase N-terminal domain-containing protein, partial [Xanthomonadales bacterium]|nr:M13 family metallopeptidase N-terminal domain-containing protein [Xanthomonadales bacterium]
MTGPSVSRGRRGAAGALTLALCLLTGVASAGEDQPTASLPYSPSLDLTSMDRATNPCEDFYQYACGGWLRNNPIPADRSRISTYGKLHVDSQSYLWGLLEDVARDNPERSATQRLIGDYFAACMDLETIDRAGSGPLQPLLGEIDAIDEAGALGRAIGTLIGGTDSSAFFFALGSEQDAQQSDLMIGTVIAAGLGLPEREYYLADDAVKAENRQKYVEHLGAMFRLLGQSDPEAAASAATVLRIETRLAAASLTQVEKRDPYKVYNRTSLAELKASVPALDWDALFEAAGLQSSPWLNVDQPAFMLEVQKLVAEEPLQNLKTYLRWGLVNTRAQQLAKPFRDQDFAFYSAYLEGIDEQE